MDIALGCDEYAIYHLPCSSTIRPRGPCSRIYMFISDPYCAYPYSVFSGGLSKLWPDSYLCCEARSLEDLQLRTTAVALAFVTQLQLYLWRHCLYQRPADRRRWKKRAWKCFIVRQSARSCQLSGVLWFCAGLKCPSMHSYSCRR